LLSPWRESGRRRAAWFGLIAAVAVAHALFGLQVISSVIAWNVAPPPRRIEITFARPVRPTAPPPATTGAAAPPPPPAPRAERAVRSARPSSAPAPASAPPTSRDALADSHAALLRQALALAAAAAASQPAAAAPDAGASGVPGAAGVEPAPATGSISLLSGSGNVSAPVAAPSRPSLEWPPSTRLTYTLTGERGAGRHLYGRATVEWRREGSHYQVQFDIHITPMIDQHMFSDGTIAEDGLRPRHYDESFSFLFSTPRTRKIEFGADEVTLDNGRRVARLPQTQDGASQFVQFVWMFYSHPERLAPGNIVQIPLALPYSLRRWNYRVTGAERLDLAFGTIGAVHLKPILDGPRRPNEYPFEIWTAPSLQYLPVQILVKVDEHTWALLALDDLPLQAAGERPVAPPPAVQAFPPPPPVGER
jgi:hypothetical protein